MSTVRSGATTLKGNPIDLLGPELKVGDKAPDFSVQAADMSFVTLKSSAGKTRIITTVPSLDTPVCKKETIHFSQEVKALSNVEMLCVSMDLPFAQKRWCGSEGVENIHCLSDHLTAAFGEAYGVLIHSGPLKRILARAVFVIGPDDKLRHVEYVSEIANEPNYQAALQAAKA